MSTPELRFDLPPNLENADVRKAAEGYRGFVAEERALRAKLRDPRNEAEPAR